MVFYPEVFQPNFCQDTAHDNVSAHVATSIKNILAEWQLETLENHDNPQT
jgi:hypothetical protein